MTDASATPHPTAPRKTVVGVFLLLLGLFCLTNPGAINAVDTWRSVGEAAALVETGRLRYDQLDASVVGDKLERALQPTNTSPRRPISKYGVALNLAYAPAYAAAKAGSLVTGAAPLDLVGFPLSFANALAGALVGALLLCLLIRLGIPASPALTATLATCVGSYLWPLTGITYSDPLQTAAVAGVLLQAVRARRSGTARDVHWLGVLCVVSVLAKTANAPLTAILALLCVRSGTELRRVIPPLAGWTVVGLATHALATWARYGSAFTTGYDQALFFHTPVLEGLRVLLVSPERGLIWFFPLLPLSLGGLVLLRGRERWLGTVLIAAIPVHLAVYATFQDVHGGHCLGPRYLLVLLPILAVGLAEVLRRFSRSACWTLVVVTVLWTAPMATVQYFQYQSVRRAVRAAGGVPSNPIVPLATFRLLAGKTWAGPDAFPLARFAADEPEGVHVLSDWDNSGVQWWWVRPHPRLPAPARYGGAALLGLVALVGGWWIIRASSTVDSRAGPL